MDELQYYFEQSAAAEIIEEDFARIGREPEPYVLCETLEIIDESCAML